MTSQAITCGCAGPTVPSLSFRRSVANLRLPKTPFPLQRHLSICTTSTLKRSPRRLKYSAQRLFKKGDGMLYVEADPSGADSWKLEPVIKLLKEGAVGVIPTDTVYAIVCDLKSPSSIERLRRIKDIESSKPLSILCRSFRDIDIYTMGFPRGDGHGQTNIFRVVKHCLPGPYTFILPASKELPKQCIRHGAAAKYSSRKHIGVRMPDDPICQAILENLDAPLICTSVKWPAEDQWMVDPVIIADIYEPEGLDFVVAGGTRVADPSTVVDMTGSSPAIVRQGKVCMLRLIVQHSVGNLFVLSLSREPGIKCSWIACHHCEGLKYSTRVLPLVTSRRTFYEPQTTSRISCDTEPRVRIPRISEGPQIWPSSPRMPHLVCYVQTSLALSSSVDHVDSTQSSSTKQ